MTRKIRVLRVIARMNVGGPALQVATLTTGLDPARFDQRLLIGSVAEGEADYLALRAPHVPAVCVDGLGRSVRPWSDADALRRIVAEVRSFRPDIVHTHTAKAGVIGRLAARAMRPVPRTVHTFHGHLLHGYFSPPVTRAVTLVERALAARTDWLIAVGATVRDDLLAAGIGRADAFTVVAPGVALPALDRAASRARFGVGADVPVVAFVARLTSVKRPDRMVSVAERVLASRPDLVVLVVGEGPLVDETRARAAALGASVRFLGWVADVEQVYAAADLVLLTSTNEGMPVTLIEAASTGCPAVSTRVGSVAEVVEDGVTGLLVDEDETALATAVLDLLGDEPRRRAMSAAAAERARRLFGPQRLVADVAAVYERLLAENRR